MYVLDDPHVNLIQLAGWQLAQVSHCQHAVSGLAAVFWDQVADCAADGAIKAHWLHPNLVSEACTSMFDKAKHSTGQQGTIRHSTARRGILCARSLADRYIS